jgi:SAM-dependent MidA family methyltransferase
VTALARLIREEIQKHGPMGFDRFMELALYHPELGYYTRRDRDPFGARGDFFTASQMQPVFGRAIARAIRDLKIEMGSPAEFTVVELGPGRGEMAEALREFRYVPVESGSALPENIIGVVFSNEFFDAQPVRLMESSGRERRVGFIDGRFVFLPCDLDCELKEVHERSVEWMERIARNLECGFVLTIDYGYTNRESIRFPQGSLMSYRAHVASEDVLAEPGERDITSHVPFDVLREAGERAGLETRAFETLSQFLLRVGERDQFAELVKSGEELALKTLLYGMGETFRVLTQCAK